jgi:outer membrane lipopolysaccharide assembly protein LptE/RlpB
MKRITILLAILLLLFLTACGGENGGQAVNSDSQKQSDGAADVNSSSDEEKDTIEVDKNLFNVEITIPASLIADEDPEQIKAEAEQEEGIISVTVNSDGSLTYKMTKAAHKKMIDKMKESLEKTMDEIAGGSDFPSIKEIKANKSYTEFTMVVEREIYENSFDAFATFSLGLSSMFYQVFDGKNPENIKTTIHIQDSNTGEVFDTIVYPDAFN